MTPKVLCVEADPEALSRLMDAVTQAEVEPLGATSRAQAIRLAASAAVVVASGEEGLEALARLALDRPALIRLALVDVSDPTQLLSLIDRVHPWTVVPRPLDLA